MLTPDELKAVLASPEHRQAHGLELPQPSLTTLATDQGAFDTFYSQWTAQGQPRYVPPDAAAPAPAPAATGAPAAPVAAPVPPVAPAPPAPPVSPYGPPPTIVPPGSAPVAAPSFSRDPAASSAAAGGAAAFAAAPPYASGFTGSPNDATTPMAGTARPGFAAMLWGFGIATVGVIITVVTFVAAAPGQTFVVAWGSIIFGTIRGIMGAVRWTRSR